MFSAAGSTGSYTPADPESVLNRLGEIQFIPPQVAAQVAINCCDKKFKGCGSKLLLSL
jgi:hypothetical protein